MSKISPLMGVNARFGKEVRQTANALKKAADGRIKLVGLPNVAQKTRAAFPELPASGTAIIPSRFNPNDLSELPAAGWKQNPAVGSKLNVLA